MTRTTNGADKIHAHAMGIQLDEDFADELLRACRAMPPESVEGALRDGIRSCQRDYADLVRENAALRQEAAALRFDALLIALSGIALAFVVAAVHLKWSH